MAEFLLDHGKGLFPSAGGVNEFDSFGLPYGEVAISLGNLLIKIEAEIFEPILLSNGPGSSESATSGLGRIEVENQSEIGLALGDGEVIDKIDLGHGQAAGIPLEDGGGVVEAVGNDPFASSEGGMNQFADEFGAAGGKEEELRFRGHGLAHGIVFEKVADGFADGGAAGFPHLVHGQVGGAKPSEGGGDLGAFAAAFAPFKSKKATGRGHSGISRAATAKAAIPSPRP
ncbi:MAG: hypothetical protein ABS32_04120, partial [Verrucomicrobia subdivision 6 bacterium BACL9 MAG-120820-bin42]